MYHIAGWIIAGLIGAAVGGATVYFWDDLKAWSNRMLGYILDAINWVIEIASDAITYIGRKAGYYYRQIKVWVKDRRTGTIRVVTKTEEVTNNNDIPEPIRRQLGVGDETEAMRTPIRR